LPVNDLLTGEEFCHFTHHRDGDLTHAADASDLLFIFGCHGLHQDRIPQFTNDGEFWHEFL